MKKLPDNFVKNIKKLENYLILREEDDYLLMGTEITIKEHKEIIGNIFQPYSKNVDKNIYITFLISFAKERLEKGFRKIPTLFLENHEKSYKLARIKDGLDSFIKTQFE